MTALDRFYCIIGTMEVRNITFDLLGSIAVPVVMDERMRFLKKKKNTGFTLNIHIDLLGQIVF